MNRKLRFLSQETFGKSILMFHHLEYPVLNAAMHNCIMHAIALEGVVSYGLKAPLFLQFFPLPIEYRPVN